MHENETFILVYSLKEKQQTCCLINKYYPGIESNILSLINIFNVLSI